MPIRAKVSTSLVTVDFTDVFTEDDLVPLFGAFETACQAGPFVVVSDTIHMKSASRAVLAAFSDRVKTMPALRGTWLGSAVVISSPAVRFMLSTILMMAPMPTEVKAFDERRAALRWCGEILRRAGVRVPAELST
jgi:hypothetical protein